MIFFCFCFFFFITLPTMISKCHICWNILLRHPFNRPSGNQHPHPLTNRCSSLKCQKRTCCYKWAFIATASGHRQLNQLWTFFFYPFALFYSYLIQLFLNFRIRKLWSEKLTVTNISMKNPLSAKFGIIK